MLSQESIAKRIEESSILQKVVVESLGDECFIKKFNRSDTIEFSKGDDIIASMVYVGVVDEDGNRVFTSTDQVAAMDGLVVTELMKHVSAYNTEDVKTQAKK